MKINKSLRALSLLLYLLVLLLLQCPALSSEVSFRSLVPDHTRFHVSKPSLLRFLCPQQTALHRTDRLIVKYKSTVSVSRLSTRGQQITSSGISILPVQGGSGSLLNEKVRELEKDPDVEYVSLDYRVTPLRAPNDPYYQRDPYTSKVPWFHTKIGSEVAWEYSVGGAINNPVKVCVVDSGLRYNHPDFYWKDPRNNATLITGWNLVPRNQSMNADGSYDPPPDPSDPYFRNFNDTGGPAYHGTRVAGLVAMAGNNKLGTAGMNWFGVRMYICRFLWDAGGGWYSDAIRCFDLCHQEGAMIYQNAWTLGWDKSPSESIPYQPLYEKMREIQGDGGLFVFAAVNADIDYDKQQFAPISYNLSSVLAVGGSSFVNGVDEVPIWGYGKTSVDIMAPAVWVLSVNPSIGKRSVPEYFDGCSAAAAVVSGAVALLQSAADRMRVRLTMQQMKKLIMDTVDTLPAGAEAKYVSGGRLNVGKAMKLLYKRFGGVPPPISPIMPPGRSPSRSPLPKKGPTPPSPPPPRPRPPSTPLSQLLPPSPPTLPGPPSLFPSKPPLRKPPSPLNKKPPPPRPLAIPSCGKSFLKGAQARQSSTYSKHVAAYAVKGNCNGAAFKPKLCSKTTMSKNAWWTATLPKQKAIRAVAIKIRSDGNHYAAIGGARVYIGKQSSWSGLKSVENFALCGVVPRVGLRRGQRVIVYCKKAMPGKHVTIMLPKKNSSLVLCEVDIST